MQCSKDYFGIGASISTSGAIQSLPYAGFLRLVLSDQQSLKNTIKKVLKKVYSLKKALQKN